jgi:hypothetical protein
VIFAVLGVLVALAAGGFYVYRQQVEAPVARTPEETVVAFLNAVFTAANPSEVGQVVCSNWDPDDAMTRTVAAVPEDANVSWADVALVIEREERATVRGYLYFRMPGDTSPGSRAQWRFNLVDENGWRVCDAVPLVT